MRERTTLAVSVVLVVALSGCALRDRRWGACGTAGAVIGAAAGGIAGGVATNNALENPANRERGGAIAGGVVGGGLIGALLGHAICDPLVERPVPPPPAPESPPPPPPAPGTKLATLGAALFDFDRAELRADDGRDVLAGVVKTMRDNPGLRVVVEGHTDSVGAEGYNQRLSERRAEAVRRYLVREGIDAGRIDVRGFAASRPVASNATADGRAQNRRAEVIAR